MSRLTAFAAPPKLRPGAAAPHQYRLLGERILITEEHGRWALLARAEYDRFLAGLDPADPLWAVLQPLGFVAGAYDFDAAARRQFERSLLSWKGPGSHVLLLDGAAGPMSLETARAAVEFAFACPGPQVTLELVCADAAKAWPAIWFAVQYARLRGEWAKRPTFLVLRCPALSAERVEYLRGHGVTRCLELSLDGRPSAEAPPAFKAQRARATLTPGARDPRLWADWFTRWGFESVRLLPASWDAAGVAAFLAFYEAQLDWLVEKGEESNLRDEWALSFLAGRLWNLPGMDVLEQLAYDASGGVFTSETAASEAAFRLGDAKTLRYDDLAGRGAVRATIAASLPDNQPQCSQCAYRPYCAVPASASYRAQGTVWGQTPSSAACALHMGVLDRVFSRLDQERTALLFEKWALDLS